MSLVSPFEMGNAETKKKQQLKADSQQSEPTSRGKILSDTKKILLLHKSSDEQLKVVRNFRDALTTAAHGSIRVANVVNIADGKDDSLRGLPWLEELNNIVLICLTSEAIAQLEKIVRDKRLADENGHLHGKVFSISFGESLASEWPPKGLQRGSLDARDFHFGFSEVAKLKPQDFERSEKMNALVAAIKGTQ